MPPRLLPLLLVIGLACQANAQDDRPYSISVDLNLVLLQTTVRDRNGLFVSDLRQQDFEVYEDGVRQSIRLFRHEDVPVTVGLVVDHSGSMRHKLTDVIAAAQTFVQSSSPEDQMFVVNFNEKVMLATSGFTNRAADLGQAISSMPAAGQTALYDAFYAAQDRLQTGGPDKKVLIVISDGGDTASAHHLSEILRKAERSTTLVYTIGIFEAEDPDRNPDVLRRLAHATGGDAFFPAQFSEVVEICTRIAHDIRNQYSIGYVSNNISKPGGFRAIRVVARQAGKGKLSVRTRSGYIAGAAK